jgi:hypothetical protein
VTTTIAGSLELAVAIAEGTIARKGLHMSSAAPTPTSRRDQPGRRALITPAALGLTRFWLKALPDTVSPLVVVSGRDHALVIDPARRFQLLRGLVNGS